MKLSTYPSYKSVKEEFAIKHIPSHWNAIRVRFLLRNGSEGIKIGPFGSALKIDEMVDSGFKVYGQINVIKNNFQVGDRYVDKVKYKEMSVYDVKSNDIMITMMGTSGKCRIVPDGAAPGIFDSHITRVRTNDKIVPKLFEWLVNEAEPIQYQTKILGKGSIMHGLNSEIIKSLLLPVPPLNEQAQIAAFLDRETAKIDRLLEKQQRLIELLEEKRQAVISHAVTKGLNPNTPMKNSGIEWFGEVPEHWRVLRSKILFEFVTSGSRGWAEYYSDEGDLFFRITNLSRDSIEPKLTSLKYVSPPESAEGRRTKIQRNDILLSITADLGSVCVANSKLEGAYVSQHVSLCRPNRAVADARWLAYALLADSSREQFNKSAYGGTKVQLSLDDIREIWLATPPLDEQITIANELDQKVHRHSLLITKAKKTIKLLTERRTSLISAAVTGKIDVRNQVPQDVEEAVAS